MNPTLQNVNLVIHDVSSGTFWTDRGDHIAESDAAYLTGSLGVPQVASDSGQAAAAGWGTTFGTVNPSVFPANFVGPLPVGGVYAPKTGPVTANINPSGTPAASATPGFLTQIETWIATGNNAMYAGIGTAVGILGLALLGGGKRKRR